MSSVSLNPAIVDSSSNDYVASGSRIEALHNSTPISTVYYTPMTIYRPTERVLFNTRFTASFQSLSLPAQGLTCLIPNIDLVSTVLVRMTFAAIPANVSAPQGWGYGLIEYYKI